MSGRGKLEEESGKTKKSISVAHFLSQNRENAPKLAPQMEGKWKKIEEKSDKKFDTSFESIWGAILMNFWSQNGTKLGEKAKQNWTSCVRSWASKNIQKHKENLWFWLFGGVSFSKEMDPKTIKKRSRKQTPLCDGFLIDFGPILEAFGEWKTMENRSNNRVCYQRILRTALYKWCQRVPQTVDGRVSPTSGSSSLRTPSFVRHQPRHPWS